MRLRCRCDSVWKSGTRASTGNHPGWSVVAPMASANAAVQSASLTPIVDDPAPCVAARSGLIRPPLPHALGMRSFAASPPGALRPPRTRGCTWAGTEGTRTDALSRRVSSPRAGRGPCARRARAPRATRPARRSGPARREHEHPSRRLGLDLRDAHGAVAGAPVERGHLADEVPGPERGQLALPVADARTSPSRMTNTSRLVSHCSMSVSPACTRRSRARRRAGSATSAAPAAAKSGTQPRSRRAHGGPCEPAGGDVGVALRRCSAPTTAATRPASTR